MIENTQCPNCRGKIFERAQIAAKIDVDLSGLEFLIAEQPDARMQEDIDNRFQLAVERALPMPTKGSLFMQLELDRMQRLRKKALEKSASWRSRYLESETRVSDIQQRVSEAKFHSRAICGQHRHMIFAYYLMVMHILSCLPKTVKVRVVRFHFATLYYVHRMAVVSVLPILFANIFYQFCLACFSCGMFILRSTVCKTQPATLNCQEEAHFSKECTICCGEIRLEPGMSTITCGTCKKTFHVRE